ncbi:MAG: transglutaminase-like domain-containing protein [Kofleriaceae bacterium]
MGAARSAGVRSPTTTSPAAPEICAGDAGPGPGDRRGATTDYAKAVRLRDWLQGNLSYTLDLRDPGGREPIDYFLFERKAGHCEYFASAFAVMGRAVGLRTRSVNGFLGGEWNEFDDYITVRPATPAWTEVYFEGFGWLTFDATPSGRGRSTRPRRGRSSSPSCAAGSTPCGSSGTSGSSTTT